MRSSAVAATSTLDLAIIFAALFVAQSGPERTTPLTDVASMGRVFFAVVSIRAPPGQRGDDSLFEIDLEPNMKVCFKSTKQNYYFGLY
jgi:hypothetical protein